MEILNRIQSKAKKAILLALNDTGRALLQMATGTGKTNAAKDVLVELLALKTGARVLWLNHSNELIEQTAERILSFKPDMDIGIFDGETKDINAQVIIASVQTIARKNNLDKFDPKDFDFIFVDEAHHTPAQTWREVLGHFKSTKNFGFTATPYRPDGQSLEEYFGQPVFELSFTKAQRLGALSKDISYVILTNSVLAPIVTKTGEYSPKSLERLHTTKDRNKIIISAYKKYGRGQMQKAGLQFKTICYCINAAHAKRMSLLFNRAGITSNFIVGDTKHMVPSARKQAYDTFRNTHDIEVMCAVNIFNEAVDIPDVACLLMARPTRSNIVYSQQVGRGARIIPTLKEKFVILDFVDNTRREYQGYIMSNLLKKGVSHDRVICEYLHEKDPVAVRQRVKDVMKGVERFENRFRRPRGYWTEETLWAVLSEKRFKSLNQLLEKDHGAHTFLYSGLTVESRKKIMDEFFPDKKVTDRTEKDLIAFLSTNRFASISAWLSHKQGPSLYNFLLRHVSESRRKAILLEFFPERTLKTAWTERKLIQFLSKKKYKNAEEWMADSSGSYSFYLKLEQSKKTRIRNKYLQSALNKWSLEMIEETVRAHKIKTLKEFKEKFGGGGKFFSALPVDVKLKLGQKLFTGSRTIGAHIFEKVMDFIEKNGIRTTTELKAKNPRMYMAIAHSPDLRRKVYAVRDLRIRIKDPNRKAKVIGLFKECKNAHEVARRLGLRNSQVYWILKQARLKEQGN